MVTVIRREPITSSVTVRNPKGLPRDRSLIVEAIGHERAATPPEHDRHSITTPTYMCDVTPTAPALLLVLK